MQLVQKWEASGLLEGVSNKTVVAQTLESAANSLLVYATKYDKVPKSVNFAASMTFPIVRRVLGKRDFTYVEGDTSYTKETHFVSYSEPPPKRDEEPAICADVSQVLSEKLNKYTNLKVHGVHTEVKDDGFEIQFFCS